GQMQMPACQRALRNLGLGEHSHLMQECARMQDLRYLISGIRSKAEKDAVEAFRFMEEQKIKKALAPKLWERLRDRLKKECGDMLNASGVRIVAEEPTINELILTNADNGRQVSLSYGSDVPCIFFEGYNDGGHFGFQISHNG